MESIVLLFEPGKSADEVLVDSLEAALRQGGFRVYVDRHLKISVDWARSIDERIRKASVVIAVLSKDSLDSEMLTYELEMASDAKLRNRSMRTVFVPIGAAASALGSDSLLIGYYQTPAWESDSDTAPLIAELLQAISSTQPVKVSDVLLGAAGGGVSSDSPFYIQREGDSDLKAMLEASEPTILIKGPRQSGKTSMIAQGLKIVRGKGEPLGGRVCVTDFQRLGSSVQASESEFYLALASNLARQMCSNYDLDLDWSWDEHYGPTSNLDEFVRTMIACQKNRIVWFMDEADWLFATSFADSFFALVRSWHNSRALAEEEMWSRFSVVIAYATEAHLLIQDINQSPFNVGRRIELKGFTLRQTEELNTRYGEPLRGIDQVAQIQELLDGQPFLTRAAFDVLLRSSGNLRSLLAGADLDEGPFGDHLRRVLVSVTQLSSVRSTVCRSLANEFIGASPEVNRLVAAGILVKNSAGNHVIRCPLYRRYLARHLK